MGLVRGPVAQVGCALVLILVVGLAGCAGSGGGDSFAGRLALLPASAAPDDPLVVMLADLDRAAELAGVSKPADPGDRDAVLGYLEAVAGAGAEPVVAALLPDTANDLDPSMIGDFERELGWSILDLSWFAETASSPDRLMVAGTEVDDARLTSAMGERTDGIWSIGAADGQNDLAGRTVARPIGEPLRTALDDGRLLVGRSTPPVREALDGGTATLADDPTLRALAEAMDGQDAYSTLLVAGDTATGNAAAEVLPRPFTGVAAGLTVTDGAPVVLLAYVHPTPEAAQVNAGALGERLANGRSARTGEAWNTLLTAQDVHTDGATVIARLGLVGQTSPQIAYQLVLSRDTLVTHA